MAGLDQNRVLAIDIGGTKIAVGIVNSSGRVLARRTGPSYAAAGRDALLQALACLVDPLRDEFGEGLAAIGVGTAGEVDPRSGCITSATDAIPGWTGTPLAAWCEDRWQLPCFVDNDGNAQGLGERLFGAGRHFADFVYICLGTGIGGAVLVQGGLLRGTRNIAGAIGHICVEVEGEPCSCGSRGCLEAYVSGTAIDRRARTLGLANGRALSAAGQAGDTVAVAEWDRLGRYFGAGLATIVHVLNPAAILVGGGAAAAGELLLAPSRVAMEARLLPGLKGSVQLQLAGLAEDAGLIGAASVAFQNLALFANDAL